MKFAFQFIGLALGIALFVWFLRQTDPELLANAISNLGAWAPLALAPYACVYICDTWGWHFAFGSRPPRPPRFLNLLSIRWAGDSINHLLPSAYIGGEALKVYLTTRLGTLVSRAASSVVVSKTVQSLSHAVYIALAAWAFIALTPARSEFHQAMWIVCFGAFGAALLALRLQSHGLFRLLFKALERTGIQFKRLLDNKSRLLQIDRLISDFYRNDRQSFFLSGAFYMAGWLLDTLEIFVVSHLMDMPVSLAQALAVEGFIGVIKALGFFIPGSLGIQETGILFLCRQAGIPDAFAGAYALTRRGREIVFAAIGLVLLYTRESGRLKFGPPKRSKTL